MKRIKLSKLYKEGTFDGQDEIAIYSGDEGLTHIEKRANGTYYGRNDKFDFYADDLNDLKNKLRKWRYELVAGGLK